MKLFARIVATGAAAVATASSAPATAAPAKQPVPTIDVHFHAPNLSATDDNDERQKALKSMASNNIVASVLFIAEPSDLDDWIKSKPARFIASAEMPCWRNRDASYYCFAESDGWPKLDWLERELAAGRIRGLGEMLFNYSGVRPTDPKMWPYWELAAKYDVPVFVHTGLGPDLGEGPREDKNCCPDYNASLGNPALLRPVLKRFPKLRISLQHFGTGSKKTPDFQEEGFALLRDYPSVYADLTILSTVGTAEAYEAELRRLINGGFGDRIIFGTDNLPPEPIFQRLSAMSWMSSKQRRNYLYNNAARFLRLAPKKTLHQWK